MAGLTGFSPQAKVSDDVLATEWCALPASVQTKWAGQTFGTPQVLSNREITPAVRNDGFGPGGR